MTTPRPALARLADRLGIVARYEDVTGGVRETSDETRVALVAAMGWAGDTEESAAASLAALDRSGEIRLVSPVCVWREWAGGDPELVARVSPDHRGADYEIEIRLEDGAVHHAAGRLPETSAPRARLALPVRPPLGYHDVRLTVAGPEPITGEQRLILAPRRAFQPEQALGERAAFGLWTNAYALRGRSGFGHGTLTDVADLARFAGEFGASFVGLNPLHAVPNRGLAFAPYSPSSRLYRNVLYLDVEKVPELAHAEAARRLLDEPGRKRRRAELRASARIDHEAVLDLSLPVLEELHRCFAADRAGGGGGSRVLAYETYLREEGPSLIDFCTWEVLSEHLGEPGRPNCVWTSWPEEYRDPRAARVEAFRREHAARIDFRCWLQFELDCQLGAAQGEARDAGLELGLYSDLAVGASAASAESWLASSLHAGGASVGAPPDDYAPDGQNWGVPPLDPHAIRLDGYRFYGRLLRAGFRHAGALRIDHAMQLVRLFWIPEGRSGSEGAYVAYRAEELLGVLALESVRARSVVVAEDLGTVPPELPGLLTDWGLLGSSVVYFQRAPGGGFRPASDYPARSLATIGTHDLAPFLGFVSGADLRLIGSLTKSGVDAAGRATRAADYGALLARLREDGLLAPDDEEPQAVLRALHRFLASTPAVLVAAGFDDLAGEEEPVNLPGVPLEVHRSWSRRMGRSLEELMADDRVRDGLEAFAARRSGA